MNVYCTLFDKNYIDKGIALYESLKLHSAESKLYIFAMDSITADILRKLNFENLIIIEDKDFETEELLSLKIKRSRAEYCWTCTPVVIDHVLKKFGERNCTYLDADIYFFDDPTQLVNEIRANSKSVIVVEHRFSPELAVSGLRKSGKYCVQFNTFTNTVAAREVLESWMTDCIKKCEYSKNGENNGDQKYLESWPMKFDCIHELQNLGGGVAPWNIAQYGINQNSEKLVLNYKGKDFSLVFYHFQNLRYLPFGFVNANIKISRRDVISKIYVPYLTHIEKIRSMLNAEYNLKFSIKRGYYKNPLLRFIQNYIMPFRVKMTDLIHLSRCRSQS